MRIIVLGHGLLGEAVVRIAAEERKEGRSVICLTRDDCDFTDWQILATQLTLAEPDCVLNCAGVVGSRAWNEAHGLRMRQENEKLQISILRACDFAGVQKLISFVGTCCFPDHEKQPWTEKHFRGGVSNGNKYTRGYSVAKMSLLRESRRISERKDVCYTTLTFPSLYGLNQDYSWERGHVVAHVIRKVANAISYEESPKDYGELIPLKMHGSGKATREFIFADDAARVALWATENYDDAEETCIVSPCEACSIRALACAVADAFDWKPRFDWDEVDDGEMARVTSNVKFRTLYPDFRFAPLEEGLLLTMKHFKEKYPRLSGMEK